MHNSTKESKRLKEENLRLQKEVEDLKKKEELLHIKEEKLRATLNSIGDAMIATDLQGKIIRMNPVAEQLTGWSKEEAIGKELNRVFQIINAETGKKAINPVLKVLESGKVQGLANHTALISKSGETYQIADSASPIRDISGNVIGVVMIFRDVTESYRMQSRINHLNSVLRAISEVNRIILHESDPLKLIDQTCKALTKVRSYYHAWIALIDQSGQHEAIAEDGFGKNADVIADQFRSGDYPWCASEALKQQGMVSVIDPPKQCKSCTISSQYGDRGSMCIRLEIQGRIFGILSVSTPTETATDEEERNLLKEMAGNIAFALHDLEITDERDKLYHDLAERVKELNCLNSVGESIKKSRSIDDMLHHVAELLPDGWHYPAITRAKIIFDNKVYRSTKFTETEWKQQSDIIVGGKKQGTIEVFFIKKMPELDEGPFMKQERELIENLAGTVSSGVERLLSENALEQSAEKYRLIADNSIDVIWQMDLRLNFTYISPSVYDLFGFTEKEWTGTNLVQYAPRKEFFKMARHALKALKDYKNFGHITFEANMLRKDGTLIPVEINGKLLFNQNGLPVAFQGSTRDISERKRSEKTLRESEERFKQMFQHAPFGAAILDLKGRLKMTNNKLQRILGYDGKQLAGMSFAEFTHQDDVDKDVRKFKALIEGDIDSYGMEKRYIHSSGKTVWGNLAVSAVRDANNKPIQIIGMVDDITGRKLHEKILQENEARYRSVIENSNDAIYLLYDRKFEIINKKFEQLFGYNLEEVKSRNFDFTQLVAPKSRAMIEERSKRMAIGEKLDPKYEFTAITRSGKEIEVEASVSYIDYKEGKAIQGVIRDITERKRSEERNAKLLKAIEQSPAAIVITNRDGLIEYVNPSFTKITGYDLEEVLGENPRILQSGEHSKDFYEDLWQTILSGENWYGEMRNKKKSGELYWEKASISSILNEKQEITHFVAVKEDITERKKLLTDLTLAKQKAEESDRLKSSFLANMSHEIRTPMNGIIGFTNLLKTGDADEAEQKEYIELLEMSSHRMLNLINDLIDISKIEAGQVEISSLTINMNKQLDNLYRFFRPEADKKGLKLKLKKTLPDEKAFLKTDKDKLVAILTNLIKNAIKFTERGSVEFGYRTLENGFEFYVRDTGIGISPGKQQTIFDRFVQADLSIHSPYEGAGLGLSITKAYVELLNGKIRLESAKGQGAAFFVFLPGETETKKENTTEKKPNSMQDDILKNQTILIVEDDQTTRLYYEKILENLVSKLIFADNGIEAVEAVKKDNQIAIILMDIKIPLLDGLEATRRIRKFNEEVVIIAQTAYAMSGDKEKAMEAGCNDYLSKPVIKQELISKLSIWTTNQPDHKSIGNGGYNT